MERLNEILKGKRALFMGLGNELKGDDAVGKTVLEKLETDEKIFCGEVPENFISKIQARNPEVLVIVDAVDFGGLPGEAVVAGPGDTQGISLSTHALSFLLFTKFFPETKMVILGIQPKSLEFGDGMSAEVQKSALEVAEALNSMLG